MQLHGRIVARPGLGGADCRRTPRRTAHHRNGDIQPRARPFGIFASTQLLASSKGNVFRVNFLDIIRFKQVYPFKTYSRLGRNILEGVRSKSTQLLSQAAIRQFNLVKTVG